MHAVLHVASGQACKVRSGPPHSAVDGIRNAGTCCARWVSGSASIPEDTNCSWWVCIKTLCQPQEPGQVMLMCDMATGFSPAVQSS